MSRLKPKFQQRPLLSIATVILILVFWPVAANAVLALFIEMPPPAIAPLFTPQVQYWEDDIVRWSASYSVDPNLMATIMQIESCGHPEVVSYAGAQGLFQVMPFHFHLGENMLDPDTNALRSADFVRQCTEYARGDVGLTLACYNGGASVLQRPFHAWPQQTQRYYVWGLGIYFDAMDFDSQSETLNQWLQAGGTSLCSMAASALQVR